MAIKTCYACGESPRRMMFGDRRFCTSCTIEARSILHALWRRGVPNDDLALLFNIMIHVLQHFHAIRREYCMHVRDPSKLEDNASPVQEDNDKEVGEREPPDSLMRENDDVFASTREAQSVARERIIIEGSQLIQKEREHLSASGRQRRRSVFIPFKEDTPWREPDLSRHGAVPGASATHDTADPIAGEDAMAGGGLKTCDTCMFIQFPPRQSSDVTCPYCTIIRGYVAKDAVGETTRQFHKLLCLLEVPIEHWESQIRRVCATAQTEGRTPAAVLLERCFVPWREKFLARAQTQHLPEGIDPTKYARHGWEIWKDLNAGVDFNDDDAWTLVFAGLLEKMRADREAKAAARKATEEAAARAAEEARAAAAAEEATAAACTPEPESAPTPAPDPKPPVALIPDPSPDPQDDPAATAPEPPMTSTRDGKLGPPTKGNPVPPPVAQLTKSEAVIISVKVTRERGIVLTTDQRLTLAAIRQTRLKELVCEHPDLSSRQIGSLFNTNELDDWIKLVRRNHS